MKELEEKILNLIRLYTEKAVQYRLNADNLIVHYKVQEALIFRAQALVCDDIVENLKKLVTNGNNYVQFT